MSSSIRGTQHGKDAPFVMHLERVCRLIEMGQRFTVEFNPTSDVAAAGVSIVQDIRIRIREGGDILMEALNGMQTLDFRMTLANYKRVWRIWQNGVPTDAQRRTLRWG